MSASRRTFWSTLITIIIAAVLLVLAFRGVDWTSMIATLRRARMDFFILACVILSVSFFMRGLRWRVLLSAERSVDPFTMFWATSAGYLANSFLPARAGDVLRAVWVSRNASMSTSYVFATALTERLLDVVALVLVALLSLVTIKNMPPWLLTVVEIMSIVGVVGVVALFVLPWIEGWLKRTLVVLPLPNGISGRLQTLLEQFLLGMRSFQHLGRAISFTWMTVVIWCIDAIIAVTVAQSLNLTLSPSLALLLLVALGLSSAAPSTPGYVGIYQFVAVTILTPFGISQEQALVYILVFQAVTYLTVIVWGGLGLWRLNVARVKLSSPSEQAESGSL